LAVVGRRPEGFEQARRVLRFGRVERGPDEPEIGGVGDARGAQEVVVLVLRNSESGGERAQDRTWLIGQVSTTADEAGRDREGAALVLGVGEGLGDLGAGVEEQRRFEREFLGPVNDPVPVDGRELWVVAQCARDAVESSGVELAVGETRHEEDLDHGLGGGAWCAQRAPQAVEETAHRPNLPALPAGFKRRTEAARPGGERLENAWVHRGGWVTSRPPVASKHRKQAQEDIARLTDVSGARTDAMAQVTRQLRTAARVAAIAVVVVWLLAVSFWQGLESRVPLYIAAGLTVAGVVVALLVWRNLKKSQELGDLVGADLSPEQKAARMAKLQSRIDKGEATAILTKAQMEMQDDPRAALQTLEGANLNKAQKVVANQVRATRAMIHLNLGEVKAARDLAEVIDLDKAPDPKSRANLVGVVAEAWARSGNPIEASELLDKYDPNDDDFADVRVQLWRARAFSEAHRNKLSTMRKALKELESISPQLLAVFVGQKRVHPILMQEARKRLERSGLVPRPRIQGARR